jgi:hypothetical protein
MLPDPSGDVVPVGSQQRLASGQGDDLSAQRCELVHKIKSFSGGQLVAVCRPAGDQAVPAPQVAAACDLPERTVRWSSQLLLPYKKVSISPPMCPRVYHDVPAGYIGGEGAATFDAHVIWGPWNDW